MDVDGHEDRRAGVSPSGPADGIVLMLGRAVGAARSVVSGLVPGPTRRVWRTEGRMHVEVRGAHRRGGEDYVAALERALRGLDGVRWAQVNAAVAQVVVAFDGDLVDPEDVVDAIESVERAFGVHDDLFEDGVEHPAAPDRIRLAGIEIGADVGGMLVGAAGRFLRLPRLPIEITAVWPAIDILPPVRGFLDRRPGIDAAIMTANAAVQGLTQGPTGLALDAAHRLVLLRETLALRHAWERAEPALHGGPDPSRSDAIERLPRPVPVPDGLVERYAQRVALASLGVGAAALVVTREPRRAADVILSSLPRPARLGREAFAAQTACILAGRDLVVMDRRPFRKLGRIDTVVVTDDALATSAMGAVALLAAIRSAAQDLVVATPDGDLAQVVEHVDGDVAAGLGAAQVVRGGPALTDSVRALQREGRVVAVVGAGSGAPLVAADCGIGLVRDGSVPWGAHILCTDLVDAASVVDATALARRSDQRVVAVSAAGSVAAGTIAFRAVPGAASRMVVTTNVAALVALVTGLWTASQLPPRAAVAPTGDAVPWHALPATQVLAELGTSEAGLAPAEAAARRVSVGDADAPSLQQLLVSELSNPLSVLLGVGGALATATGSITDGLLITGVLGVNALIGALQRRHADDAIEQLGRAISSQAVAVRRANDALRLPPDQVVDGDVLLLNAGDVVPADARVVSATAVETDESTLTGESVPVAKTAAPVPADRAVAERSSMVYAGTVVAAGHAEAVAVATGDDTEGQRGARSDGAAPRTGVEVRLEQLVRRTVPAVLGAGGLLVGTALLRGASVREAVSTGVSLAAAAVPEGLPFLATVAQSSAARRLSREGVLVRRPQVLEALGRADVLCFDKTGTLTEGKLRVRAVSDGRTVDTMPLVEGTRRGVLAAALRATPLPTNGRLAHPTDQAIADAAVGLGIERDLGAPGWRKDDTLPFSSTRGYHAVSGRTGDRSVVVTKGAPEVVLPRCGTWLRAQGTVALDDAARAKLQRAAAGLARDGLRVLAIGEREAPDDDGLDDDDLHGLTFTGFVAIADVVRSSAAAPIATLQDAGVTVVMLTGDHPDTAKAIGEELGLIDGDVVTGNEVDDLDDDALEQRLEHSVVFARVTPAHKVRIVEAFRRRGRVVAMTGDGANDARAIELADVGVAFGPRATPAARAAADLVVVDDDVEALIGAIVEGRAMWMSVRDALALLLGGNLGEVIFTTGTALATGRSPLNARQLLAVNLLTDLAPALAIALQRPATDHIDLRTVGPEDSLGSQLSREVAVRAAATASGAGAAWAGARFTGTGDRAGTVALAALVGGQLAQTLVSGYRSPLVVASCAVSIGALVTVVQVPGVNRMFGCRPLGPVGWALAGGGAGLAVVASIAGDRLLPPVRPLPATVPSFA